MSAPTPIPVNALGQYDEPTWAESGTATAPSGGLAASGYVPQVLPSALVNYHLREAFRWIRALAHSSPRSDMGLFGSFVQTGGVYPTGGGTLSVALPLTEVWVDGVLTQHGDAAGSPHVFGASKDSYLFVEADGTRTEIETAIGAGAPAGPAGSVLVSKTVTNGTEVTLSNLLLTDTITLGSVLALAGATMTADLNMGGFAITGGAACSFTAGSFTTLGTTGNVSCGGNLDMTNGSISNATTIGCASVTATGNVGGATLSSSGQATLDSLLVTNAASISGLLAANGGIALGAGDTLTGGAGASVSIAAIDTVDNTGIATVGELLFYADATPSATTGTMQNGAKGLTIGEGSLARNIPVPYEKYVASDSTVNATDDVTGCAFDVVLANGDPVMIELSMEIAVSDVSESIHFGIHVDGVYVGGTDSHRGVVNGVPVTCTRKVYWEATSGTTFTFQARFGASGGATATATNVHLLVRRCTEQ